jgi:hypothetical protein
LGLDAYFLFSATVVSVDGHLQETILTINSWDLISIKMHACLTSPMHVTEENINKD